MQFFGVSQTPSLVSTPKNCKNSTSTTAIRRICERSEATNTRIVLNAESKIDSSLQGAQSEASATKQSKILPLPCGGGQRGWVDLF
ncbi:hypothetical protein ACWIUD_09640 [Helicobacter sp. 23-1044]